MPLAHDDTALARVRERHPEKFAGIDDAFGRIHRGDRIFIGTGCGEPQHLVSELIGYVERHPKAFFDAEVLHVWTLGVAPYTNVKFKRNFRHNSFFVGNNTRDAVNAGVADYTPIFLSEVPDLLRRGAVRVDVALIQTSPPDLHGYLSLGVSVDIVKAATQAARTVIAQINRQMPRVHGDGFLHVSHVDCIIERDEPLLELAPGADTEVVQRIGGYVARLVQDGDTIQVGYGSIPSAVIANLRDRKHLGVHTELLSDGLVELMRSGVVDNSRKALDRGKTIAAFCMGGKESYAFIHDNPSVEFRSIDYTNDPLVIARHDNITAINSALEIDLTGQATAESLGRTFYSSVGGQADFMRGAMLARNGRTILALPSTAHEGTVSRIVPSLQEGAAVTLHRGDVHYVVTEYGIAYLHGKNVRERAMELIAIAHPRFRGLLIKEAKERNLIYRDQAFIPGKRGEYPEELEQYRTTKGGLEVLLRPVKLSDEPLLKDFFYSLSDQSIYRRFISARRDMPHEVLQDFVVIDYTREMVILAVVGEEDSERIIGVGQYGIDPATHSAEVAFVVRDEWQGRGVGTELLDYLTLIARRQGLLGFSAEVLTDNRPMMHVFRKNGFEIQPGSGADGVYELHLALKA